MRAEYVRYAALLIAGIALGSAATAWGVTEKHALVKTLDQAETYVIADGKARAHLMLHPQTGAARASMGYLDGKVGFTVPAHMHEGSAELLWFVRGGGEMTIAGAKFDVKPETAIYIPAGAEHSFRATSDFEAVQVYAAPGPEQRFRKIGTRQRAGGR